MSNYNAIRKNVLKKALDKEQQQKFTQSDIGYKRAILEDCVFTTNLKKEFGWEIPRWKRPSITRNLNGLTRHFRTDCGAIYRFL